jgi:hypothetical protein
MTMKDEKAQVILRLDPKLLERIEKHTVRMKQEHPGIRVSRADVIRSLLHERLAQVEAAETAKQ